MSIPIFGTIKCIERDLHELSINLIFLLDINTPILCIIDLLYSIIFRRLIKFLEKNWFTNKSREISKTFIKFSMI